MTDTYAKVEVKHDLHRGESKTLRWASGKITRYRSAKGDAVSDLLSGFRRGDRAWSRSACFKNGRSTFRGAQWWSVGICKGGANRQRRSAIAHLSRPPRRRHRASSRCNCGSWQVRSDTALRGGHQALGTWGFCDIGTWLCFAFWWNPSRSRTRPWNCGNGDQVGYGCRYPGGLGLAEIQRREQREDWRSRFWIWRDGNRRRSHQRNGSEWHGHFLWAPTWMAG